MRFSKSIWTDRSIEIWNSFKRQLYLFFLPPIIKSLAYTRTYALCLSLHAKPREINSSQISKFLPARVILQRGTRVLQAQTCRVHTHKYLKKYGGFRSRALPCPLADIYCRARFKNAFRAQKGTTVNGSTRARACGQRERKSRGICSYLFESVMQLSMGRSGARAYACPERAVNTFLVCAHHDLFHPIASITQTLRRARVIDKPPPPPPPPARPRPRRAFDRFPCPHYEYCILWSRVFIRVPIFSFFFFSLPSFTTFPSRMRIMSVFFFPGPF